MNQIIPTVCALAVLSTYANAQRVTCVRQVTLCKPVVCEREEACPRPLRVYRGCTDAYREPYRINYPQLCPVPSEVVEITATQRALAIRRAAIIRQREIVCFEKGMLAASTPITQPSSTGTTIFGETEGAGVFDNPCAPIPPPYPGTPAAAVPRILRGPSPVAEYRSTVDTTTPLATAVPDRPGCVYSPYGPNAGYIDVHGLAPGSLAKDPYTGRVFRVP